MNNEKPLEATVKTLYGENSGWWKVSFHEYQPEKEFSINTQFTPESDIKKYIKVGEKVKFKIKKDKYFNLEYPPAKEQVRELEKKFDFLAFVVKSLAGPDKIKTLWEEFKKQNK